MQSLKILALTNTRELLGKVVSETEREFIIEKPIFLLAGPGPDGQFNVKFVPFLMLAKEEKIVLEKTSVAYSYQPDDELVAKYTEYSSGLILPSSGLIKA